MDESRTLATYVCDTGYVDLPRAAAEATKRSLLDGLGVMLAASGLGEGCREFVELTLAGGGKQESTVLAAGAKVPSYMAAFANGSMAHAMDFEDYGAGLHPNASAIPAALAVAESLGNVSGKELIAALALACDIVCRLANARRQDEELRTGWYIPPIFSAMGAAAACGKLVGLTPAQMVDAFSLVLCQHTCSAEIIHSPRSLVRAVRDAFAAKAGVLSALLAKRGIIGFDRPIEGEGGFFTMYERGNYNPAVLTDCLGSVFGGTDVAFKPWPACAGTHPYIQAALEVAQTHDVRPADIREVTIVTGSKSTDVMLVEPLATKRKPRKSIDAKFSIPFTVATALVQREVTLDHFMAEALEEPRVLEVAGKVSYRVEASMPDGKKQRVPGLVEVTTAEGKWASKAAEFTYGHPKNPMSDEALVAKFMSCAKHAARPISEEKLRNLVDLILHLEAVPNISAVMARL